jgi:hypothetical protein
MDPVWHEDVHLLEMAAEGIDLAVVCRRTENCWPSGLQGTIMCQVQAQRSDAEPPWSVEYPLPSRKAQFTQHQGRVLVLEKPASNHHGLSRSIPVCGV